MFPDIIILTLKAVLFYGPQNIKFEEIEKPRLQAGEVLVKVEAALTGGTDVKTYQRGHPKIIKSLPSAFGYEFSGTIAELSEEIYKETNLKVGDRVVTSNTAPCYDCYFCKKKEYSLCENLNFLNGSFAEYIIIPGQIAKCNLYKIPSHLSFSEAAITQTLAAVLHGFKKSEIKTGDLVAVLGLGAIGQTFIKLCKNYIEGVEVVALGRSEFKKKLARENGADHIIDISNYDNMKQSFKEVTSFGADVVIEAVGKPEIWSLAFDLVRPGGLVNFFGGCSPGSKIELDTYQVHYQETKIIGVFHHSPGHIREALDLLSSGQINMNNLITHEMPLAELEQALQLTLKGEALKVLIKNS